MIVIEMENGKEIEIELMPEAAPKTCENFEGLVKRGFYDGLIFHRVIRGFMIQGGCPNGDGSGDSGKKIEGEFSENGYKNNDIKHIEGVLSMARTQIPDSASSQFFIMHHDAPHLDGQYAGFGRVTEGLEIIDAIASVKTGNYGWYMQDVPEEPVVIDSMEIVTK